mmetsp:Transcript_14197/g.26109  ORF Transcript_14197/g.26109 Transcript_14197/m.26109 type:complete len:151 (+) Transcript_14197:2-454(+)
MVKAAHYTNAGGAVAVRNDDREQYNIAVLRHKWPGVFPQHGTRGVNEVRMTWPSRGTLLGGTKNIPRPAAPPGYESGVTMPPATKKNSILNFFSKAKPTAATDKGVLSSSSPKKSSAVATTATAALGGSSPSSSIPISPANCPAAAAGKS